MKPSNMTNVLSFVAFAAATAQLRADYSIASHRYLADRGSLVINFP
jgi:hypothetical protein